MLRTKGFVYHQRVASKAWNTCCSYWVELGLLEDYPNLDCCRLAAERSLQMAEASSLNESLSQSKVHQLLSEEGRQQ